MIWHQEGWTLNSDERNFGDLLLFESAEKLFDFEALNNSGYSTGLFGGSVLSTESINRLLDKHQDQNIFMWGTGIRSLDDNFEVPDKVHLYGLRGKLSKLKIGKSTAIGDPGLIAPLILGVYPKKVSGGLLFAPHILDDSVEKEGMNYLDLRVKRHETSRDILEKLSEASFVLTGSLHVGVACFVLGTPFCFYADKYVDCEVKFHDFGLNHFKNVTFVQNFEDGLRVFQHAYPEWLCLQAEDLSQLIAPVRFLLNESSLPSQKEIEKYLRLRRKSLLRKSQILSKKYQ